MDFLRSALAGGALAIAVHLAVVVVQASPLELVTRLKQVNSDVRYDGIQSVDKREYRHCHNIGTRVYCHKKDRLPRNWPPLSDTPHRN